ncbi:MAG: serine--tRNA ligase [Deltaproteobacteria bacterium]|nr:serine--tRNA ligase [Deltaproteobacteria bacterium]
MLDLRQVGDHLDEVKTQLARRGYDDGATLDRLAALVSSRSQAIVELEECQRERNEAAQAMGKIADKSSAEFAERRESLKGLKERMKALETTRNEVEAELEDIVLGLPNLPHESTPDGKDESANVVVREWGEKPAMDFTPKDHVELGDALGILDFDRAAKITGARFVVLRGLAARLERGLMQLMLDMHVDQHGYEEVWCPALVNADSLRGTSQLPKFASDLFHIERHQELEAQGGGGQDLFLVPTAEVPVTNLHRDEILEDLPKAYAAYTPCFRSEAGSYGKDTRGMIRQHQFDKVELVRFCTPEDAIEQHALLTQHAEKVLQALGLHYRVVELCAGDLGFGAAKCFDIEVWLPAQNAYREISSCSWFGDFQARRLKARYRSEPKGKPRLLHTINGSGLAIGRTLVAILEQHQRADGSVTIPEALRPYVGGAEVIEAK